MNTREVVDKMLESDNPDPNEFITNTPNLFVRYEFVRSMVPEVLEVKRWEKDSYYYLGSVRFYSNPGKWTAYVVAPSGANHVHYVVGSRWKDTKEEAAEDLWAEYSSAPGFKR